MSAKTRHFDDYLAEEYAKDPSMKLDVELAGILIDVQLEYAERVGTPDDAPGGFEKQQAQIKALFAQATLGGKTSE